MVALFTVPIYHTTSLPYEAPVPAPAIIEEEKKTEHLEINTEVLCNCYAYQKSKHFPDLPSTVEILENLEEEISSLAVFYYPDSGLYHYAKVTWTDGYNFTTDEANLSPCKLTQRTLNLDYPRLIGFYTP